MSRPRIIWLGNSTQKPVPALLDQLRIVGEVHVQRELRQLLLIAPAATTTPADFCIIHWEYADQWSVKQLNDLAQAWPLTSYVVVVGEWATSATRHGPLWPQAEQFARDDFCIQIALGAEYFLSELRTQQPLLTERWDDRTLRAVQSAPRDIPPQKVHCISASSDTNKLWKELLSNSSSVIQADVVCSADELAGYSIKPLTDVLIVDTDLPSSIIDTWLQHQTVQPRKILLLSSMLREQDRDHLKSIRKCYLLSKPTSWQLVAKILSTP